MTPAQAKNMLFTTRYPTDKIVEVYEGSFTANASSSVLLSERTQLAIPHTFGQTCFLELIYSLDGGTTWQDMDMPIPDTSGPSPIFQTVMVAPYSTTTDFVVVAANMTTSSETVQYILTASWKE